MADRGPRETRSIDAYGHEALPWSRASGALDADPRGMDVTWFLGVTDPDGAPHAAAVGAVWSDGGLYFTSGPGTRKSRDLAAQPAATLSVAMPGIDLVFEGPVERVTDRPTLERLVGIYKEAGWPAEVAGDAFTAPFSAPAAGPPPWYLFRLAFHTVYGTATAEPHGASRWRFGSP